MHPFSQPIYDDMLVHLLAACPSYKGRWVSLLSDYRRDHQSEERIPLYVALKDYCKHLIFLLSADDKTQLSNAFDTIEQLLANSDDYVQVAAMVGMLESLQNITLHSDTSPKQFYPFLGEVSQSVWDELWTAAVSRLRRR